MTALLAVDGVTKTFGALSAVDDVTLHVEVGEAVGLIGPNGAGKTTLFNVVLGVLDADDGRVHIKGRDVTRAGVHSRARLGVGRTFQRLELFGTMTPRQHLLVAAQAERGHGVLADLIGRGRPTSAEQDRAAELLELVGLTAVADHPIESLSLGLGRMVELGRALMGAPDLLLLDEPSSGLDRTEAAAFATVLEQIRDQEGTAILFVEHDLDLVLRVVSRLYVMDAGQVIADGDPEVVMATDEIRRAYLGDLDRDTLHPAKPTAPAAPAAEVGRPGPPVLELVDVHAAYGEFRALFGVDLRVGAGSATALLGSNGAGKTTVARVCSGLVAPTSGEVRVDGHDLTGADPHELARMGILHVPEGRSVFATLSVEENLELSFRALEGRRAVRTALDRAYELFPRLGERRRQIAATLSGGEQRMLSLARAFPHPPRLLIADELSLGLAPVVVDEVFAALARLRDEGTAVLIVEQHVTKALALADNVAVLVSGEVVHAGSVADVGEALDQLLPAHVAAT